MQARDMNHNALMERLLAQTASILRERGAGDWAARLHPAARAPAASGQRRTEAGDDIIDIVAREVQPSRSALRSARYRQHVDAPPADTPVAGERRAPPADATQTHPTPARQPAAAGVDALLPRFSSGNYSHAQGTREYKLFLPAPSSVRADAVAPAGRPLPLLVMLHGCTQNADDFAAGTRMNEAAQRHGFAVLYPVQSQKSNPQRCWNWFKHSHQQRGRGEAALLADMTRHIVDTHGLDARRVYVAGLSAGGAMAAVLGDCYPELFAAVGVHSGLAPGVARDLPSALAAMNGSAAGGMTTAPPKRPTIVIHGRRDATVHPSNAERFKADANHRLRREAIAGGSRDQRVDADGRVWLEHWFIDGAPHAWSGGSAAGSYTHPAGPCATTAMLRFFELG